MTGRDQGAKENARVAIIGMACLYPGAPDLASFWKNIVSGYDAIREATDREWGSDPDSTEVPVSTPYCKQGGFITEYATFDPLSFGIMPKSLDGADPDQLLALKVASEALKDSGYASKDFNRERAEVILGRISSPAVGSLNFIQHRETVDQMVELLWSTHPELTREQLTAIASQLKDSLRPANPEALPSVMPNILAGRIANRLDFRGPNMIIDAACASSLIAIEIAIRNLLSGQADMVLTGGLHLTSNKYFYHLFCDLGALSHKGRISPFDNEADGTLLGEGFGMVMLKRLDEAISDGDRIYATICGIGTSSDGRGASVLAPTVEGEALAMKRAYEMADVSPQTVGLLEAHGTGTIEGDFVELKAIEQVFGTTANAAENASSSQPWCALGSVKSMIGHCQAAAGVAGVIKTALSLYHRVLPPTLNVQKPNTKIDWSKSPCYVNTEARPWIHPAFESHGAHPRRAAVSAFGFGGVNAHCVLEEFPEPDPSKQQTLLQERESELFVFAEADTERLIDRLEELERFLHINGSVSLKDVAYTVCRSSLVPIQDNKSLKRLAIVASDINDLSQKIRTAKSRLQNSAQKNNDSESAGIYLTNDVDSKGKVAFILPGLGAAYPNMLSDLCIHFPEVREVFDYIDLLAATFSEPTLPSRRIFPPPGLERQGGSSAELAAMESAVVAVLMSEYAIYRILDKLGIKPDCVMGCSTGEFAALVMSGSADILNAAPVFYEQSTAVARAVPKESLAGLRSLMVLAHFDNIAPILKEVGNDIYVTADLSPKQLIVTGTINACDKTAQILRAKNIAFYPLPAAIPYHTPLVADAVDTEHASVQTVDLHTPEIPIWACSTGKTYPADPEQILKEASTLFEHTIQMRKTIEAMYEDGVRTFVEVGPKNTLTELVDEILAGRSHSALATNISGKSSITQLHNVLAKLFCLGVPMLFDCLFERRKPKLLELSSSEPVNNASKTTISLNLTYPAIRLKDAHLLLPPVRHEWQQTHGMQAAADVQDFSQSSSDYYPAEFATETVAGHSAVSISSPADQVMENYLDSIAAFHKQLMDVQQSVLQAFVEQPTGTACCAPTDIAKQLPFLRNATIAATESQAQVTRVLSLEEDLYLLDHAIGGSIAAESPFPQRMYLVPLMVALEMMAETATLLIPGMAVSSIENVRAYKRISVDNQGMPIDIVANLSSQKENVVSVETRSVSGVCLMSCDVVFTNQPKQAPQVQALSYSHPRPPQLQPANLYGPQAMFHGPRMQSVLCIEQVGDREISGQVQVRPPIDWFRSDPELIETSGFLIDPLLLDNASQLVLFHLFEHDRKVSALLPFHIDSIKLFGDRSSIPGQVRVQAQLRSISETGTEANVQIIDQNNQLIAELSSISSKRIQLADSWKSFIQSPVVEHLSELDYTVVQKLPQPSDWKFARFNDSLVPSDTATLDWCADYVLTSRERDYLFQDSRTQKRKREWLAGRIAAKDAIRQLLKEHCQVDLCPCDIEILQDEYGQPTVRGWWQEKLGFVPQLSIAHTEGIAVALAGKPNQLLHPGTDTEPVRSRGPAFEDMAFTKKEHDSLYALPEEQRESAITRYWCAKESLAKSLSYAGTPAPQELQVEDFDWASGAMHLSCKNNLYVVYTYCDDDVVVAVTIGQTRSQQ